VKTPNVYFASHPNAGQFCLALDWIAAIYAHDHGDPNPLSDLIGTGEQIPKELIPIVADIIAVRRPPKPKKGAFARPGHAVMRFRYVTLASRMLGKIDHRLGVPVIDECEKQRKASEIYAEAKGIEPQTVRMIFNGDKALVRKKVAVELGISEKSVNKTLEKIRAWITSYPELAP
jgi:hypothetical protein